MGMHCLCQAAGGGRAIIAAAHSDRRPPADAATDGLFAPRPPAPNRKCCRDAPETVDGAAETVDGAPVTVDGAAETVDGDAGAAMTASFV